MHQEIAVIGKDPVGLVVTFKAEGEFAGLTLQLQLNFVADGLALALIRAGTDHKVIGEGSNAGEIQYFDVGGFLGLCRPDGYQPGWRLGQNTLLLVSYYSLVWQAPRLKRLPPQEADQNCSRNTSCMMRGSRAPLTVPKPLMLLIVPSALWYRFVIVGLVSPEKFRVLLMPLY